jgi:hypothetical protein
MPEPVHRRGGIWLVSFDSSLGGEVQKTAQAEEESRNHGKSQDTGGWNYLGEATPELSLITE